MRYVWTPNFEPAQGLQQLVQQESDRSQLVSQYLEASKLRLAEGLPEEAESLLAKVAEIEPSNKLATALRQQVVKEKAQRELRPTCWSGWTREGCTLSLRL